jgi:hypothetical protein
MRLILVCPFLLCALCVSALTFSSALFITEPNPRVAPEHLHFYLGFDRNIYPGDDALPILRKTFSFASYWLSPPPGEKTNTWSGKRDPLRKQGFGFVVLFRGREEKDLKSIEDAANKGEEDARATVEAAQREGFGSQTIIYLDIEEGGRLSLKYHKYLIQWLWHVSPLYFRGGFYCSGIPVKEGKGKAITTCEDILDNLTPRSHEFSLWAYNDACPPSPGCTFPKKPPSYSVSVNGFCENCISIWQFAQSPRRKEFAAHCPGYARDNNCYAPADTTHKWHLDVNTATSPDPSGGAK